MVETQQVGTIPEVTPSTSPSSSPQGLTADALSLGTTAATTTEATCTDPKEHPLAQQLPLPVLRSEGAIGANGGGRGEQGVEAGERGGAPQFHPVSQQSNSLNNVIAGTSSDALSLGVMAASTTEATCTNPKEHELVQQLPPAALRSESATAVNGGGRGEQVVEAGGGEGGGAPQFCPIP